MIQTVFLVYDDDNSKLRVYKNKTGDVNNV